MAIAASELILNPDGSIYHLNLLPHQIAHDIITVGDPDRVNHVTKHFDSIEHIVHKREFKTVTGTYKGKRLSVISTGIGTDNIDIVFMELDALVNIDLNTRTQKEQHTTLRFYRIGTSGAIQPDIDIDSIVISRYAIGLEGLMHYYNYEPDHICQSIAVDAAHILNESIPNILPYCVPASQTLVDKMSSLGQQGITLTATGFYGPQGRSLRIPARSVNFIDQLGQLKSNSLRATNLEMETAGIYGMAHLLGHEAVSLNAILANRANGEFSNQPGDTVEGLIVAALGLI